MSSFRPRSVSVSWLAAALLAPAVCEAASVGIGELWIVDTSTPDPLQTQIIETPGSLTSVGRLQYEIGFSTKEQIDLGFLFDSITISLERLNGANSANLVTGDVFGLTVTPLTPGGLLSNGGITVQQIAPPVTLLDGATTMFAYSVEVALPPALVGEELRSAFSFFNNGDEVPSAAYAILIPEPSAWGLIGLAGGLGVFYWGSKRRSRS